MKRIAPDQRHCLRSDGDVRTWPVPEITDAGSLDRLRLRLEIRTGLTLRNGTIEQIHPDDWQMRRQRLVDLEGSAENAHAGFLDDCAWYDREARIAQSHGHFAALWHLDRLREMDGRTDGDLGSAKLLLRRSAAWAAAGKFAEAEANLKQAEKLASKELVRSYRLHGLAMAENASAWPTALWYLDRLIPESPADWSWYAQRAAVHGKLGQETERQADVSRAIEHGADAPFLLQAAEEDARQGRWEQAAERYARVINAGPAPLKSIHQLALVHLRRGDQAAYAKHCRLIVGRVAQPAVKFLAHDLAWLCALGPEVLADPGATVALAELARKQVPPPAGSTTVHGATLYRAGRFRDAIDRLHDASKVDGTIHAWIFLAMAHHRLGETDLAKQYLTRVNDWHPPADATFWANLEIELLRGETRNLLKQPGPK